MTPLLSRSATLAERLDHRSEPYVEGRCRLWLGVCNKDGYGILSLHDRPIRVHRATWECEKGPIPDGLDVLHSCDNRPCRNIDHLFLGTNADNVADKVAKGRQARGRTGRGNPGEENGRAKLTEAQVREIRKLPGPLWNREIAVAHGVDVRTIYAVRAWKTWRHVAE
jgi:hypothetical protein